MCRVLRMCDDLVAQVVQSLCPVDVTQSLASKQQDVEAILAIAAALPGGAAALSSRSAHPPLLTSGLLSHKFSERLLKSTCSLEFLVVSGRYEEALRRWLADTGMAELGQVSADERQSMAREGSVAYVRYGWWK